MSAFLGPIHYWLYRKISLQDELTKQIIALAAEKGLTTLGGQLDEKYGCLEDKELEEMIDVNNIHGWLQDKVSMVEYRLAEAVTTLLKAEPSAIAALKTIFYSSGEETANKQIQEEALSLPQLFKGITDALLDGMPCDHALQLIKQEADEVVWQRRHCVHAPYWQAVGGTVTDYYTLRTAWLEGFAYGAGVTFTVVDEATYALKRG